MNNLSWFIYFTQMADTLQGFAQFVFGGGLFLVGGWLLLGLIYSGIEDTNVPLELLKQRHKPVIAVILVSAFIIAAVPDRRTMLLIAGSEMGERALKSEPVQEIVNPGMDLVKLWIKKETEKLSK